MQKKSLAIFDLDGTLFCGNSTFDFIAFVMGKDPEYQAFKRRYKFWRLYNKVCRLLFRYDWYKKQSVRFLKNYRKETLEELTIIFYEEELVHKRIELVYDFFQYLKERDDIDIGLITATIDPIANIVADKLGIPLSFCTHLHYENGLATGEYKEDLLHKKMKIYTRNLMRHYDKIFFCSDNPEDVKLMKNVSVGLRVYGDC